MTHTEIQALQIIANMMPTHSAVAISYDSPAYRDLLSGAGQAYNGEVDVAVFNFVNLSACTLLELMAQAGIVQS